MRTLLWYRSHDLRVTDHAPLRQAARLGEVVPVFVLDPEGELGADATRFPHATQYLLESLAELRRNLAARGSDLLFVPGRSRDRLPRLAQELAADRIVAHRATAPRQRAQESAIARQLGSRLELYDGETLAPAGSLRTRSGRPYSVFTAFARAFAEQIEIGRPLSAPRALPPLGRGMKRLGERLPTLKALGIPRNPKLLPGGEAAARARLRRFLKRRIHVYPTDRDRMDRDGTSRLSADLKFGTVSGRTVWHAVDRRLAGTAGAEAFLRELLWREFAYHTLADRPELLEHPFRPNFERFPWRLDAVAWQAWVTGRTGYPVVDASARQLIQEGFVHNRARMISASFLTKHLLIGYPRGEAHYLAQLADGHPAPNNLGWQWAAGSGCDAQPYFRIFNPVTQGEKFDPDGDYVRRFVPELAKLPARWIHRPWRAPTRLLHAAQVELGRDYPLPIIDLGEGRKRFQILASSHLKRR